MGTKLCNTCSKELSPYEQKKRYKNCQPCTRRASGSLKRSQPRRTSRGDWAVRDLGCTRADFHRCRTGRCIICNVPPWTLKRYRLGAMQVGHLVPGDANGGFEPMCKKCNVYLGCRRLTQETGRLVLHKARRYWSRLQMRDEAWQHTDVDERGYGFGGVNDSDGRAARLAAFSEEHDARRKHRQGESGCTDSGGPAVPAVGQDDSVVLENPPDGGHSQD